MHVPMKCMNYDFNFDMFIPCKKETQPNPQKDYRIMKLILIILR